MGVSVERLSNEAWVPSWVRHQHETRYQWVAPLVAGLRVIDAACGTGYGTAALADAGARSVLGVDIDPSAVAHCQHAHVRPNLRFTAADATKLPLEAGSADVFVSLETIEHLPDADAFLAEVCRVLTTDGRLICSTPNRLVTNPGTSIDQKPYNPFHLREYSRKDLYAVLAPHFGTVEFFGQDLYPTWYVGLLSRVGGVVPRLAVRAHQVLKLACSLWDRQANHRPRPWSDRAEPEILVAVCSGPVNTRSS